MFDLMSALHSYSDGIAVTLAVYFLSPPADAVRNALVVGGIHGVLHGYAAHKLVQSETRIA